MTIPPDRPPDSLKITAEWNIELPDRPPPVEPPVEPPIDPTGETIVTARNGQWWKFKGTLQNGRYVNGDPWVYTPPGTTVEVVQVSHHPVDGRNGGMINPTFNDLKDSEPLGNQMVTSLKQGYDSRAVQPGNVLDYDEAYNAHVPLMSGGTIILKPGHSLVSAESFQPELTNIGNSNSCAIARMACVTIVDHLPEPDEFRPNYFGITKIRRRCSDADLSLLPSLEAPYNPKGPYFEGFHLDEASVYPGADAGEPHPNRVQEMEIEAVRHLQYWVYPYGGNSSVSFLKPLFQQAWYPAANGTTYGKLAMYCMCNFEDRGVHLVSLVQLAIDAYAVAEGSRGLGAPFAGGAGYYASPLWPIRLAGLLFGDDGMKNARDIPTGKTDFYGNTLAKWGEINRCYYSTDAHAQYRMPAGLKGKPLYGDAPNADVTHGQSSNGTARDPQAIYDAHAYKWGLPTATFPDIMPDVYEMMLIDGAECQNLGSYMYMTSSMMGNMLSSMAMGDQDFWGGAVVDFALRVAHDPQMWEGFGINFDYSNGMENTFYRDIKCHGGSGNGWMAQMWDIVTGRTV